MRQRTSVGHAVASTDVAAGGTTAGSDGDATGDAVSASAEAEVLEGAPMVGVM